MTDFSLDIKAGPAFGSGAHETTRAALLAMEALRQQGRQFFNILDMGCGSGILSLVAAQFWPQASILAADIMEEAVEGTRENAAEAGLAERITVVRSDAYHHGLIGVRAPYDLILCNILAEPIIRMAGDFSSHLAKGGVGVLSGILVWLQQDVEAAHRAAGLNVQQILAVGDWRALMVGK